MNTLDIIRTLRIQNNGLTKKYINTEQCIHSLIGVQSQYFNHASLVICSRSSTENSIEKLYSLLKQNKIIDIWGQRSTLHFYHINDWEKIVSSFGKTKCWVKKFCDRNSFDYNEELDKINALFEKYGDLTINQIIELGTNPILVKNWGGLLVPLSLQGSIYIRRFNSLEPKHYCSRKMILDRPFEIKNEFLKELLMRYFFAYGPATYSDFLHWSGLHFEDIKQEFNSLKPVLNTLIYNKQTYYYVNKNANCNYNRRIVNLLPKFDPLLVAYKNKSILINEEYHSLVWKKAGQIEACIFSGNKFIGTWKYLTKGSSIDFFITLYCLVTSTLKQEITNKCLEYSNYMNKKLNKVIFE